MSLSKSDLHGIENAVVAYRGRVVEVHRRAFREAVPQITDEDYESLRRSGLLCMLSIIEEGTHIEYLEERTNEIMYGGTLVRAHWEQQEALTGEHFAEVLGAAIRDTCKHSNLPEPGLSRHTDKQGDSTRMYERWLGQGFIVTREAPLPMFDFQMITDIGSEIAEDNARFKVMMDRMISYIDHEYNVDRPVKDIDGTHDFTQSACSILQSRVAQNISHPLLAAVRTWLERKV